MKYLISIVFMLGFLGVTLSFQTFAQVQEVPLNQIPGNAIKPTYRIMFTPPTNINWKEVEVGGNSKAFIPQDKLRGQVFMTDYRSIKGELKDSMQDLLNATNASNVSCKQRNSTIQNQDVNSITFTITLAQCEGDKSFVEIVRIFSASDGQYMIRYIADSKMVSPATIDKMRGVIESSKIIEIK